MAKLLKAASRWFRVATETDRFVCYACSLSIGLKSRAGLFWREPLVDGKGVTARYNLKEA